MNSITNPLVYDGHAYDAFVVIHNPDFNAGFSVDDLWERCSASFGEELVASDQLDNSCNTFFYDPERGENIWEYFGSPSWVSHTMTFQKKANEILVRIKLSGLKTSRSLIGILLIPTELQRSGSMRARRSNRVDAKHRNWPLLCCQFHHRSARNYS